MCWIDVFSCCLYALTFDCDINYLFFFFFFQAEDGIRDRTVTGVQTCALPISVVKVPMQFFILLLGALVFMFYQFEKPPVYFNRPAYERAVERGYGQQLATLQTQFNDVFEQKRAAIRTLSSGSSASSP